jgi:hypothetical protein
MMDKKAELSEGNPAKEAAGITKRKRDRNLYIVPVGLPEYKRGPV